MPTDIVMPQMGESIFEGTITKWLKKAGDTVEKDEPLFEISTDKVDAEIPSPVAGILSEIKIAEGATVEINTVVAVIGGSSAAAPTRSSTASREPSPAVSSAPKPSSATEPVPEPAVSNSAPVRSSPLVRRIARENNLDLGQVARTLAGSGAGGRITKEDVLKYLSEHGAGSTAVSTGAQAPAGVTAPSVTPVASTLPDTVVPLTRMRAIIADRMVESVAISP